MVDVKPSRHLLRDARSTHICQSNKSDEFSGSAPFQMGNHNYIPIPIMLPPAWHAQYPQTVGSALNPQPSAVTMTSSHGALHSSHPDPVLLQIEQWFATLENDVMCNQRGIEFGTFGRVLAQNGFTCITQLLNNTIPSPSKICRTGWRLMQGQLHLSWSMLRRMCISSRKQEVCSAKSYCMLTSRAMEASSEISYSYTRTTIF